MNNNNHTLEERTFEFKRAGNTDKPAIWFFLRDQNVMVFPFELLWFLWDCYGKRSFCKGVTAHFQFFKDEVCGYFYDCQKGDYYIQYNRDLFLESAKASLRDFANWGLSGKETMYMEYREDELHRLLTAIDALVIPRNYSQIFDGEIITEDFHFEFTEPYNCDTHYRITIGDRCFESNLSEWSNEFNHIRIEMELFAMAYLQPCKVNLHYEDSPTVLRLNNVHLYHNNGMATKVTIVPDEFAKGPICFGWCNPKQLLSSLYLGLLSLCIIDSDWFDDGYEGYSWEDFRLATYNKLQSCVIENAILGKKEDDATYTPRQRIINSVEDMLKDYRELINKLKL